MESGYMCRVARSLSLASNRLSSFAFPLLGKDYSFYEVGLKGKKHHESRGTYD